MKYPQAVVFDLDYTLWPCWCDTHVSPPLKTKDHITVTDKYSYNLSFYKDVPAIIKELRDNNVTIIAASRTHTPQVAKKLLTLFHIDGEPAINYFDNLQWGTFSKKNHIQSAIEELDDPININHVILFDDESRNKDVESIGVQFAYIADESTGLTHTVFKNALKVYNLK